MDRTFSSELDKERNNDPVIGAYLYNGLELGAYVSEDFIILLFSKM